MNILKKINIERYYKMDNEELEHECRKFSMGSYFNGNIIRREKIIEQLIAKDNAIMFSYTVISTLIILSITFISLTISLIAIFLSV